VDHVVTDDGRGDADVLDLQRRGRGHFDGVLVKDGEVGQLAFFNGADQAFNVILVGRGDGHSVDGLEWVEALNSRSVPPFVSGYMALALRSLLEPLRT